MDQRRPPRRQGGNAPGPRGKRPADRPRGRRTGHPTPRPPGEGEDRLQKVLAHAGLGSRRGCEELITQGRVTINGQVVRELGTKVDPKAASVAVDGQKIHTEKPVYYAVYKPKGYVSTNADPSGRPRVLDLLPEVPQRVYTVGRLDEMSVGLMLLTNDGELAHKLAHPKYGVEKLYRVVVAGMPTPEILKQLTDGIWLAEGKVRAKRVKVAGKRGESTILEMVLSEGKNREVRRMLAKFGHKVMSLTRVAVGPISLKGLSAGQSRPLTPREVGLLRKVAAGEHIPPFGMDGKRTVRPFRPAPTRSGTTQGPSGPGGRPLRPGSQDRRPAGRPLGQDRRPPGPGGRPAGRPGQPTGQVGRPSGPPPSQRQGMGYGRPSGPPPSQRRGEDNGPAPQRPGTGYGRPSGPPPSQRRGEDNGPPPQRPGTGYGRPSGAPPSQRPVGGNGRPSGPPPSRRPGPEQGHSDGPPRHPGGPPPRPDRPSPRERDDELIVPPVGEDFQGRPRPPRIIGFRGDGPPRPRPPGRRPPKSPPPRRGPGGPKLKRPRRGGGG